MAASSEEMRRMAIAELARREIARRQSQPVEPEPEVKPEPFSFPSPNEMRAGWEQGMGGLERQSKLTGRAMAEGVVDVAAPFANAARSAMNRGLDAAGSDYRFPEQTQHFSESLTHAGVPEPKGSVERGVNTVGRFASSMAAGAAPANAILARMGSVPKAPPPITAQSRAVETLDRAGVTLDRSQRSGGRFMEMLRSAVTDHPFTASRQADFTEKQLRQFTRAALRSIGESADEATQPVMASAKQRISSVFDDIGRQGAGFDDALQSRIASIVDDAQSTVTQSDIAPLLKNVDDLLNAVDDTGRIAGEKFVRIRSNLSNLSRRPGVGQRATELEDAMLDALERSYPGQRAVLNDAIDQWRNMRIIEGAIGKGTERFISPLRLSNAMSTMRNRAMSVYGQGGDQKLVKLAQAGREVLPDALPNSGTVPRGLMQAPVRAIVTAPGYRIAQRLLHSQPKNVSPKAAAYGQRLAEGSARQ